VGRQAAHRRRGTAWRPHGGLDQCTHATRLPAVRDESCQRFACRIYKEGHREGYEQGFAGGEAIGRAEGYAEGYAAGEAAGYQAGHAAGAADAAKG